MNRLNGHRIAIRDLSRYHLDMTDNNFRRMKDSSGRKSDSDPHKPVAEALE